MYRGHSIVLVDFRTKLESSDIPAPKYSKKTMASAGPFLPKKEKKYFQTLSIWVSKNASQVAKLCPEN